MSESKKMIREVSVIIPAYNAATWLPISVPKTEESLKRAGVKKAEFIIVDDGSNDNTGKVAEELKLFYPVRVVTQPNSGRFAARYNGAKAAKYKYILYIDTRIFVGKDAIDYVFNEIDKNPKEDVWTSHVIIDKTGNIFARFWEAITFISWRKYFKNPRRLSYGIKDFDYYPKGTTCFFAPREVIIEANDWFLGKTKNIKASNDDTLLIRRIAENKNINLSPNFYCKYHARTNLKQYSKHAYHRGKVFVDGFLRRDGNRFFWPLVAFLILSPLVLLFLVLYPQILLYFASVTAALWILELAGALMMGVPLKDAFALFILSPLFAVVYGAGIWSAFLSIYVFHQEKQT